jgi:hypothetical protein
MKILSRIHHRKTLTGELPANRQSVGVQCCPLCHTTDISIFARHPERDYVRCGFCQLIFVPPSQYLSAKDEKAQYDRHKNHPDDPAYRAFLSRMFLPLQHRLKAASYGLDFGSGPGPTLSLMFEEAGHTVNIYDHFYAPDSSTFTHSYDFITATEVVDTFITLASN